MGGRRPGFRHPGGENDYEEKKQTAGPLMQSQHIRKTLATTERGEKLKQSGRKKLKPNGK